MKGTRVEFDKGKNEGNNLSFPLEKKMKEYKEGIDYTVDKTGNYYTILSERLKKVIWPSDYLWYDESIVAIDREGKINSWRIAAEKENPTEPYKRLKEGGYEEIMKGMNNDFGRDKERKPLEQKPFQEEKKFEEDMSKELVWKEVKIPQEVNTNLESPKLFSHDNYDSWTKNQLISEINRLKAENEALKNDRTLTDSERQERIQQNQQKLEKYYSLNLDNNPKSNNWPTNLVIGGTVLAIVGLISFLVIRKRKTAKFKKRS